MILHIGSLLKISYFIFELSKQEFFFLFEHRSPKKLGFYQIGYNTVFYSQRHKNLTFQFCLVIIA